MDASVLRGRVLDATSHAPLEGAAVQFTFYALLEGVAALVPETDLVPTAAFTRTEADGRFVFAGAPTGGTRKVAASLPGYLPREEYVRDHQDVETALARGRTVRVAGSVHDDAGAVLTNARVEFGCTARDDARDQMMGLHACDAQTDDRGQFAMETVPYGLTALFAVVTHADYPDVRLPAPRFDTLRDDVWVDLVVPRGLVVSGIVRFASGRPVTNERVWARYIQKDMPDNLDKYTSHIVWARARRCTVFTDSAGLFVIKLISPQLRFVVQTAPAGYLTSMAGPWDQSNPPPPLIEIVVDASGGWLVGTITDTSGAPVTNVSAQWSVEVSGQALSSSMWTPLGLDVDDQGTYASQRFLAGLRTVRFQADSYRDETREVSIRDGEATLLDLRLVSPPVVTGLVCDALTRAPLAGVRIEGHAKGATWSPESDDQGRFWVKAANWCTLTFQCSNYATATSAFSQETKNGEQRVVMMSPAGAVLLHVEDADGAPVDNLRVRLVPIGQASGGSAGANQALDGIVSAGRAALSNVPSHMSPFVADLHTLSAWTAVATSETFTVEAGKTTDVHIKLPPTGKLAVRFAVQVSRDDISVELTGLQRGRGFFYTAYPFNNDCVFERIVTGAYSVLIRGGGFNQFRTNASVLSGQTTVLEVSPAGSGVIAGTVRDEAGHALEAGVQLLAQGRGGELAGVRTSEGAFKLTGLDSAQSYRLRIAVSGLTNIVVRDVRPDGPPIAIVIAGRQRVTATLVDKDRNPVQAQVRLANANFEVHGDIDIDPVYPGTYTMQIVPQGFAAVNRTFTVRDTSVDLGEIVLADTGVTLRGRVLDTSGVPVKKASVNVALKHIDSDGSMTRWYTYEVKSGADGSFELRGAPRDVQAWLDIHAGQAGHAQRDLGPYGPSQATDEMGDVLVKKAAAD